MFVFVFVIACLFVFTNNGIWQGPCLSSPHIQSLSLMFFLIKCNPIVCLIVLITLLVFVFVYVFVFVIVYVSVFAKMMTPSIASTHPKRVGPWCNELLGLRVRQLSNRHFVQDKGLILSCFFPFLVLISFCFCPLRILLSL